MHLLWLKKYFFLRLFKIKMDTNYFEHRRSFTTFTFFITLYAFIGFGLGTLLDIICRNVRGSPNNRLRCFGVLCLWILLISLGLYFTLKISNSYGIVIDNWIFGTYEGFVFFLSFLASQTFLGDTAQCAIRGKVDQ